MKFHSDFIHSVSLWEKRSLIGQAGRLSALHYRDYRRAVPRPKFIDIPPLHHDEPSNAVVYTTEPGEAIVLELDLVLDRKHEVIGQRYASVSGPE